MSSQGEFVRLLETERRLEERLRQARAEGETLVATAAPPAMLHLAEESIRQ